MELIERLEAIGRTMDPSYGYTAEQAAAWRWLIERVDLEAFRRAGQIVTLPLDEEAAAHAAGDLAQPLAALTRRGHVRRIEREGDPVRYRLLLQPDP